MTYFEYEAIYFGIIVGLALANILASIHKLVEAGSRVRWSWMAPATAAYAATHTINEFWFTWIHHQHDTHQTIFTWYPSALAFALLYLMCGRIASGRCGRRRCRSCALLHRKPEALLGLLGRAACPQPGELGKGLRALRICPAIPPERHRADARKRHRMRLEPDAGVLARDMVARPGAGRSMGMVILLFRTDAAKLTLHNHS